MKFVDLKVEPSFVLFNNFILVNLINKKVPVAIYESVTKANYVQSNPIKYLCLLCARHCTRHITHINLMVMITINNIIIIYSNENNNNNNQSTIII